MTRRYALLCLFFLITPALANDEPSVELKAPRATGPYCGIHSLYFCLDSLGVETEFKDFISVRFVGSPKGSNAKELVDTAEYFGAHAEVFTNLTLNDLYRIKQPMILHTRSSWEDGGYDHWVAFLGFEENRGRILNYPHALQNVTLAELLANWDGNAIVISKKPVDAAFIGWAKLDIFILVASVFSFFYFCHALFVRQSRITARPRQWTFFSVLRQSLAIVLATFVVGMGYHFVSPIGFLQNPTAVAEVTRRYHSVDIPTITWKELDREMNATNPPCLIDARRSIDFQHGSIPQAITLPIDSSLPDRQIILKGILKSQRILVFCQSQHCGYAADIAKFLKFNGYENVAVYSGGYREWEETKKKRTNEGKYESL